MAQVEVFITLKSTVADPQGLVVKHALENLGYGEVDDVRVGKLITLRLKDDNKDALNKKIDQMCKKLLANPIIEDYKFQIQ
ncbi:MAG: phosphoribosylformylglycinamidine synthase subunit PurS [Candidatus Omnitrophica bacterium]|nr:phosphoribosylformylglycinamidine synthase subunit PurS [Candidatus Omnitrophota bacterium]